MNRSIRTCIALVALAMAGVLAAPAMASPTTLAVDGAVQAQPYQGWVDRSEVPTPPGIVNVFLSSCPVGPSWASACVFPDEREIHLGADGRDEGTLLHELGHLFDSQMLDTAERKRLQTLLGRRGAWRGASANDPPHEQFAEAYAMCAVHGSLLRRARVGMYGYVADPRQHTKICVAIRRAARA